MPIYTYKCPIHGEFEVEQRVTDPKLGSCGRVVVVSEVAAYMLGIPRGETVCGAPVERLISDGTSFALKGPGWAKDGYR